MRNGIALFTGILGLLLISCGGTKYIELTTTAEAALSGEDYETALSTTEQIITELEKKNKSADGRVYAIAGNSAYGLEQYEKSLTYLVKAQQQNYTGEMMYFNLASLYQRIDNLSKEITVLEKYNNLFPLADSLWFQFDEALKHDLKNLEAHLAINIGQENDTICDWAAEEILKQYENHEEALNWLAEKYFWKAENRYQAEMEAYNNNKTRKQYNILLKAFKIVTTDFKESLNYYTKLYEHYPNPDYARYLGNIYARLDDEKMAEYYRKKSRE